ncbi:MAG: Hint domain-containing protein [Rhodovarius sp.]|nr:Hint domain-containing protein [Rhodovarius sp.]
MTGGTVAITVTASDSTTHTQSFSFSQNLTHLKDWSTTLNSAGVAFLNGKPNGTTFTVTASVPGGSTTYSATTPSYSVVCFFPGTLIATPQGEVPVDSLRPGDLVLTADGPAMPVRWVGRQTIARRFSDPLRVLPVRISAGALGHGLPRRDLLLSPGHALCIDGVLVNAIALVNGTTIRQDDSVPYVFPYYHIELDRHALILAEGTPAESWLETAEPAQFDNVADRRPRAAEDVAEELHLPRAISARQVPPAIRARIAAVAAEMTAASAAAA